MKRTLLAIAMVGIFFLMDGYSQVTGVRYQMKYNATTCRYDCFIVVVSGTSTTAPQRAQFNSQYSIVVPTGSTVSIAQNFNPVQGNNSGTLTTPPLQWVLSSNVIAPTITPTVDYYSITPTLSPTAFYGVLTPGTEVRLFSLNVSPTANCTDGIRIFDNPVVVNGVRVSGDPMSSEAGMGGGDFANGFTIGGIQQDYIGNLPKVLPPQPVLVANPTCSNGLEIDLSATTSTCQAPLTYAWTGPNGYSATTQDVNIPNAPSTSNGSYRVIVTDKIGCKDTLDVTAFAKPVVAPNANACAGTTAPLVSVDPKTGIWSTANTNPVGSSVGATTNGDAIATLGPDASGIYNFIYSANNCNDTIRLNVTNADAGPDPANVLCNITGTSTLNAVGTGVWSIASTSAGTSNISSPTSNTTNVSGFSVGGNYFFVWTTSGCTDTVRVVVGEDCSCPVNGNTLVDVNPNTFCGSSGVLTLIGNTATPAGTYGWQYSLNNGPFAAAPGTNNTKDYTTANLSTGSHRFRRIYTITLCSDTSNILSITVNPKPAIPSNLTAIPNPICLGNTVNLNVTNNPGASYTWSATSPNAGLGSSTTNTNTLNPSSAGAYTVSVTQTLNGCVSDPASTSVTVDETPTMPSTLPSTNPTACGGTQGTITFSGLTPNTTYTINYLKNAVSGSGTFTTNASGSGVLSNLGAGAYTNIIIVTAAGCTSTPFAGPINLTEPNSPSAPSNIGAIPNPACLGTTVNLSVTNNAGAIYTWSSPQANAGLGTSTTNTNTMLATVDGFYTVNVTQTVNGCTSPPASVSIGINPAPTTPNAGSVTPTNPSLCAGSDGVITINGLTPNTQFTINYNKNGATATPAVVTTNGAGMAMITGLTAGSYSNFRVTNFNGCSSGTYAGPVNLSDPNPPSPPANLTANPNPVCLGTTINLSVTNNAGAVYNWSAPAGAGLGTSTTNTNTMTPTAAGTYVITVTQNLAGCLSLPATVSVVVNTTPATPTASSIVVTNPTSCGGSQGSLRFTGLAPNTSFAITYSKNGAPSTTVTITSDATGNATVTGLSAGAYTNISLAAGICASGVFAGPINITDPSAPATPIIGAIPNPSCFGQTINLTISNPVSGATFAWSASSPAAGLASSTTTTNTMLATSPGVYTISVTQSIGGCTSIVGTVLVDVLTGVPTPTVSTIVGNNPTACGTSTGSIAISGLTANTAYTITYSRNGVQTTANVTTNAVGIAQIVGLSSGTYTNFSIAAATGCPSGVFAGPINLVDPGSPAAPAGLTPRTVCLGQETTLTVTNNPSAVYTWSASSANAGMSSSTSNSVLVTPTMMGTYTISVSQTIAGCTSPSASTTVTVIDTPPTPSISSISSANPTACGLNNGSISISGLLPNTQYLLSYTKDGASASATLTTNASGVLTLSNLGGGAYGNFSLSTSNCSSGVFAGPINIIAPATPNAPTNFTANPNPVCVRNNVNLSVTGITGATYTWTASSPNAGLAASTSATNTMLPTVAGTYNVSVTQTVNGCTSPPVVGTVTVNGASVPTNVTANPSQGCIGEIVNLSASGTQGATFNWTVSSNNAGLNSSTSSTTTMLPTDAGTYTISVTQSLNGCVSTPATLDVPVVNCQNSTIGDFVWNDLNANGIQNIGEPGIAGVRVQLFRDDDVLAGTTMSSSIGAYSFANVIPGNYYLKFSNTDLKPTFRKVGTDNKVDSDIDTKGETVVFEVKAGVDNRDMDAGYYQCNKIGELVWYDVNKNDVWDPTENGINGLIVKLFRNINGKFELFDQTTTGQKPGSPSDDGWYQFCAPPGSYYIQFIIPPSGLVLARPNIGGNPLRDSDVTGANGKGTTNTFTIIAGQNKLDIGAGYYPMAIAGNLVWLDGNANGMQDVGEERVQGIQVEAYDANTLELLGQSLTNEQGVYKIDYLGKQEVFYKFSTPAGLGATIHDSSNDKMNSDVDHSFGLNTTRAIKMEPGVENPNIDLGLSYSVLPLNWEYINASKKDDGHLISWKTSQEVNVDYFEVERLMPGGKTFEVVSNKIRANNLSSVSNMYLFEDINVKNVGLYTYRIKQVDFDGRFAYSQTASIRHSEENYVQVYPNPTTQYLSVEVNLNDDAEVSVKVYGLKGELLSEYGQKIKLQKGQHIIPVDLKLLPTGIYTIVTEYNGQKVVSEVVKN